MEDIPPIPRPQLELRDLQLALALAAAGSTARAASVLHLSQPAISRALRGLEDRLGSVLFERTPQGLSATAAGQRLLDGARELLLGVCDLEQRVCSPAAPVVLRVVCECYTAYHWLPSALTKLRGLTPGVEVDLDVAYTGGPVAALESGKVDVALLTTERTTHKATAERPLFSDEVVFVVAQNHALAAKKKLTREDLCAHTLLTSSQASGAERQAFLRAVFGRKRPRLTFQRLPLTEAILDVTRAGMGIAVLSEWIAAPHLHRGDLVARRLDSGPLRRPWRFAYRREHAAAALRLLAILEAAPPQLKTQ